MCLCSAIIRARGWRMAQQDCRTRSPARKCVQDEERNEEKRALRLGRGRRVLPPLVDYRSILTDRNKKRRDLFNARSNVALMPLFILVRSEEAAARLSFFCFPSFVLPCMCWFLNDRVLNFPFFFSVLGPSASSELRALVDSLYQHRQSDSSSFFTTLPLH